MNSDFLNRHARDTETNVSVDYSDYPQAGQDFVQTLTQSSSTSTDNKVRSGRGGGSGSSAAGTRKIFARKRLINSQIVTPDRSAWYYHYHDYGCYCVAPTDETKNRGKPVDEVDRNT